MKSESVTVFGLSSTFTLHQGERGDSLHRATFTAELNSGEQLLANFSPNSFTFISEKEK